MTDTTNHERITDPALHALWVIRNWTRTPLGNLTTHAEVVRRVHRHAAETLAYLTEKEKTK